MSFSRFEESKDHCNNQDSSSTAGPSPSSSDPQVNHSDTTREDYDRMGVITARPRRPDLGPLSVRLTSFGGWPQSHHLSPQELTRAGYFYTGTADCVRCFFCGGGLRNWEEGDSAWIEHARWFPKCGFIRSSLGQAMINVVQDLNQNQEIIPYDDVIKEMMRRGLEREIPKRTLEFEQDAAVKVIIDDGFHRDDVIKAAKIVREKGHVLSAVLIYDVMVTLKVWRRHLSATQQSDNVSSPVRAKGDTTRDQETLKNLETRSVELRQQSLCKICRDKDVCMVFLPCRHFISCVDCSFAFSTCPLCRENIVGVVRANLV